VHLPHWPGTRGEDLAAALRQLPDVTHAEANPLTGNVLILFDRQRTSAQSLLEALPSLRLETPTCLRLVRDDSDNPALAEETGRPIAATGEAREPHQAGQSTYLTGTAQVVYKALGWSSVGMAVVGAVTPGIPTTPFVVLAGYFFVRSSPEAHQWLRQSRWFGPLLRDWEEQRGVRRSVRNAAAGLIAGSMVLTALIGLPVELVATIISLQLIGLAIVLRLRVIEPTAAALPSS
jgi:uncharacterized membrane protein YbaN (DUF454 family)